MGRLGAGRRSHPLPPSPSASLLLGAPEQTSVPLWASVSPPVRGALSPRLSTLLSPASSFLVLTHDRLQGDHPLWGLPWGQLGVQVGTPPSLPGGTSKLRGTTWAVNLPSAGPRAALEQGLDLLPLGCRPPGDACLCFPRGLPGGLLGQGEPSQSPSCTLCWLTGPEHLQPALAGGSVPRCPGSQVVTCC